MSLSGYVTRHRVGLKRSVYTALGITAGAAASLYAQQQLSLPPDDDRVGPPPAVLRAKVPSLWLRPPCSAHHSLSCSNSAASSWSLPKRLARLKLLSEGTEP